MKTCFIDVETTGLNCLTDDITQIGCIITDGHHILSEFEIDVKPIDFELKIKDPSYLKQIAKALEVQGKTTQQILSNIPENEAFGAFYFELNRYKAPDEKYIFGAYNATFDAGFLREWFIQNAFLVTNSFFNHAYIDPKVWAKSKRSFKSKSLVDVYRQTFRKDFENPHDALSDIKATFELAKERGFGNLIKTKYPLFGGKHV